MKEINEIRNGDICSPSGFKACGIKAGLKKSGKADMSLVYSETECIASGLFTSCRFQAAPVKYCRNILAKKRTFNAIIINSGNANACTGTMGYQNSVKMAKLTSKSLGIHKENVFVCSTGRIGVQMPMDIIESGIIKAVKALSPQGGKSASEAIMTTDTFPKKIAVEFKAGSKNIRIGGMAKGAGMIAPKLNPLHATMICILTTDAFVSKEYLDKVLFNCSEKSFNRISVDGDTSTNDTVLILANGLAGNKEIKSILSSEGKKFAEALECAMLYLAKQIVLDGEGATKFVTVKVEKARNINDAQNCARTIADSLLCKTAWFGCDPNWGRILAAAGRSNAIFNPDKVDLYFDDQPAVQNGMASNVPEKVLAKILAKKELTIKLILNAGKSNGEVWTNDISYDYVKINANYHT